MFGGIADLVGIRAVLRRRSRSFAAALALGARSRLAAAPVARRSGRARCHARSRDRAFVGGLWLNTLPALFFGALDVLVPLELDDAGYGALAIAAVFVAAGLVEVAVNPIVGRVSDRHGRLAPGPRLARRLDRRRLPRSRSRAEPLVVAALVVAASVSFGGFYTPGMALVADRADRAGLPQGIGFGVTNRPGRRARCSGPAVGGALAQAFGDAVPYLAVRGALRAHARRCVSAAWRACGPPEVRPTGNRSSAQSASSGRSR